MKGKRAYASLVWIPRESGLADELNYWGWMKCTHEEGRIYSAMGFRVEWTRF